MNKQDMIDVMAESAKISKNAAQRALDTFFDKVMETISNGEDATFVNFGTFTTSHRAERTGRNPQTGAPMTIPAATVPRFKAGKKLKDAVNKDGKA